MKAKEATKIHEVLNYVLDKAILKQEGTKVKIQVNYSDLCNEFSDKGSDEEPFEAPSMVDLVIEITTSFDTRNELLEFQTDSGEEDEQEERLNGSSNTDTESH